MEYISEEEDKDNKEENEDTHANASGISLAVRPWSRKYSLILPILSFRSRKRVVVVDIFLWCLSVLVFFFAFKFRVFNPTAFLTRPISANYEHICAQSALYFLHAQEENKSLSDRERRGQTEKEK